MSTSSSSAIPPLSQPHNSASFREEEINLIEYLWVIVKNRWHIVRMMVLAGGLVAGLSLTMPNIYEAKVTLLPVAGDDGGGVMAALASSPLAGMLPLRGRNGAGDPFQAVLASDRLKQALIDHFHLEGVYFPKAWDSAKQTWRNPDPSKHPSPQAVLRVVGSRLTISTDRETGLVSVAVQDTDPDRAAKMANWIPNKLEQMLTEMTLTTSKRQRVYLERQVEIVTDKLKNLQERLVNYSPNDSSSRLGSDGGAAGSAGAWAQATVTLNESTAQWLAQSSDILKQIAALEMDLSLKEEQGLTSGVEELKARREALRQQLEVINKRVPVQQNPGKLVSVPLARLPMAAMEYLRLSQELLVQEGLYKLLRQQLEMSKISEIKEAIVFQLVDVAQPPSLREKIKPKRALMVVMAMILAGFLTMFWALVREGKNKTNPLNGAILNRIGKNLNPRTIWREMIPGMLGRLPEETLPGPENRSTGNTK